MVENKRILITGGAGFVGGHLAEALADRNDLVLLDNFHRDTLGETRLRSHPRVRIATGDVLDAEAVRAAARGCTHVVHLATVSGLDAVLKNPMRALEVNLIGTWHVLKAAMDQPALERFVDVAGTEVLGSLASRAHAAEATTNGAGAGGGSVEEARWTYAVGKLATEELALTAHRQFGLPAVAARLLNVYGPRQSPQGAIHHFVRRALRGEDLLLHNQGTQVRAWTHVDDAVRGLLGCLERREAVGEVLNLGNPGTTLTVHELAQVIVRLSGSSSRLSFIDWSAHDVDFRVPGIEPARRLLEFSPEVGLEEGLRRTIAWYRGRPA